MLCLGDLMIVLDSSIVNVALPSIQADLGFSQSALAWVVNAYLLTFGGFLLLSGRLGDLLGNKRVFQGGVVSFTVAVRRLRPRADRRGCWSRAARSRASAVPRSRRSRCRLIMGLFSDPGERAKAMGFFGFVMSGGGAVGVLLGGVLTGLLNWHWIFLVNVPIGIAVWVAARTVSARGRASSAAPRRLDVPGAVLVTAALMLSVYGVVGGNEAGLDLRPHPRPARRQRRRCSRSFVRPGGSGRRARWSRCGFRAAQRLVSQVVGVLWAAAMFAWFFLAALYLQQVLGYGALEVGLAFLPTSVVMAYCSLQVSDRLVMRFGIRPPLVAGLAPGRGSAWRCSPGRPSTAASSSTCCPR